MKKVIPRVWLGRPTFCATPLGLAGVGLWKLVRLLCKAPLVVGWVVDLYAYLSVQGSLILWSGVLGVDVYRS
jgi:hypothetical protein